jgi:hypothetical protein
MQLVTNSVTIVPTARLPHRLRIFEPANSFNASHVPSRRFAAFGVARTGTRLHCSDRITAAAVSSHGRLRVTDTASGSRAACRASVGQPEQTVEWRIAWNYPRALWVKRALWLNRDGFNARHSVPRDVAGTLDGGSLASRTRRADAGPLRQWTTCPSTTSSSRSR